MTILHILSNNKEIEDTLTFPKSGVDTLTDKLRAMVESMDYLSQYSGRFVQLRLHQIHEDYLSLLPRIKMHYKDPIIRKYHRLYIKSKEHRYVSPSS